jgi:hypothetical protein
MRGSSFTNKLNVRGPRYFSPGDEKAFFDWLECIPCVEGVRGRLTDLHITLQRPPGDRQLRELIAVFRRYGMDMKALAVLKTNRNAVWFAENKNAYWHAQMFGKPKD